MVSKHVVLLRQLVCGQHLEYRGPLGLPQQGQLFDRPQ